VQDLVFLTHALACRLPCWGELTPGLSDIGHISSFFGALGVGESDIKLGDVTDEGNVRLRYAALSAGEGWGAGALALDLGLDGIVLFWNPITGRLQATWISYWKTPPGFDAPSLFAKFGRPDKVLMEELENGDYRSVFFFSSVGAIVRTDVRPTQRPHLCFTRTELGPPEVILVDPTDDPADFVTGIVNDPEDLEEPSYYTKLSQDQFIDAISRPGGCADLIAGR
jgi:hypothetical protein